MKNIPGNMFSGNYFLNWFFRHWEDNLYMAGVTLGGGNIRDLYDKKGQRSEGSSIFGTSADGSVTCFYYIDYPEEVKRKTIYETGVCPESVPLTEEVIGMLTDIENIEPENLEYLATFNAIKATSVLDLDALDQLSSSGVEYSEAYTRLYDQAMDNPGYFPEAFTGNGLLYFNPSSGNCVKGSAAGFLNKWYLLTFSEMYDAERLLVIPVNANIVNIKTEENLIQRYGSWEAGVMKEFYKFKRICQDGTLGYQDLISNEVFMFDRISGQVRAFQGDGREGQLDLILNAGASVKQNDTAESISNQSFNAEKKLDELVSAALRERMARDQIYKEYASDYSGPSL